MKLLARSGLILAGIATVAAMAAPAISGLDLNALAVVSDDEIPGVMLPASPISGTLDDTVASLDLDDIYAVKLAANQRLDVEMTGGPDTDFDLQLWKPGSPSIVVANPLSYIVQASSTEGTSTEEFWYPASVPGTYSLDVVGWSGKGPYRLKWDIVDLPTPELTYTVPATVKWGGGASIVGTASLSGAGLDKPRIMIASRPLGTSGWTYLNKDRDPNSRTYGMPLTVGTSKGGFSYTVYPKRVTEYRAIVWPSYGAAKKYGPTVVVSPRATITTPKAPTTIYGKSTFAVSGYLTPKHKTGARDVKIRFYRLNKDGSYTWQKTVRATNYASTKYPTYTRYYRKTYLPSKGTWMIRAYIPGDSTHAERTSRPRYVTVK